ncbi:hypothetical protein HYH03_006242 [Edaphochlamys debaryana]|uniref:Poly(A) RNA polymerase mitochondrial-like central palm domain-containing protein n=1 Tax=Edaphochlamys debaryana TaxID=47281 RepID=A0A836C185_9CHLO|nr:hypothetical protein HYH03_006242 [Edaphochlamys debaryana]|eukprot:KAG2495642.1 hypothetical protein HYH03_006242 [Edaphochlamys debaryana]
MAEGEGIGMEAEPEPESASTRELLNSQISALAPQSLQPTPEDAAARQQAIARLQALLADILPPPSSVTLVSYGSFLTGCYSHGSDLDLALTGSVTETQLAGLGHDASPAKEALPLERAVGRGLAPQLLEELAAALEKRGAVKGRVDRGGLPARVPVIRLVEATTGVACDVCVCTRGCDVKGEAMRLLQGLQPALAPLTRLVKSWAKQHDINCALRGTLNSWSLELLTVFSLQTHLGGPLLPPLWRLFGDTPPPPGDLGERPLTGSALPPAEALARARARCSGSARAELLPSGPAPPLPALFKWFLASTSPIMEDWRAAAGSSSTDSSSTRVSTWLGRLYGRAYDKKPYGTLPYVAFVEDPFDASDNTARSLGTKCRNEDTLPYIAWVFGHSQHTLSAMASLQDAYRAFLWLFCSATLPALAMEPILLTRLRVPEATTQLLGQLDRAGPGAGKNMQGKAMEGPVDFRALLDAARVGSPVLTLSDWRSHHACCRTRPPYAWHRIGSAEAPEPEPEPEPAEVSGARGAVGARGGATAQGAVPDVEASSGSDPDADPDSEPDPEPAATPMETLGAVPDVGAPSGSDSDLDPAASPTETKGAGPEVGASSGPQAGPDPDPDPDPDPGLQQEGVEAGVAMAGIVLGTSATSLGDASCSEPASSDCLDHRCEPSLEALREEAERQGYQYAVPFPCDPPPGWRVVHGLLFPEGLEPAAELESAVQQAHNIEAAADRDAFEACFHVSLAIACVEVWEEDGWALDVPVGALRA